MNRLSKIFLLAFVCIGVQGSALATIATVNATLWDDGSAMGISIDAISVAEGKVTFKVKNSSKFFEHEMLVIKVKNFHEALPYSDKKVRIIEDDVLDYGEVSELAPGSTGSVELNLKAGKCLLLCNVAGHFEMGMSTKLIVTP